MKLDGLEECRRCTRLANHLDEVRGQQPDYHCAPVGSWGARDPRLLIVGLAPGMHGANKTGKAFVGDSSGRTLFAALHASGWATSAEPERARLNQARITNAVKCLPPENRPIAAEINACRPWLVRELELFLPERRRAPRAVLCLGGVAFSAVCSTLDVGRQRFAHGSCLELPGNARLYASFHPSRQNVNTGRLSVDMLEALLKECREFLHLL